MSNAAGPGLGLHYFWEDLEDGWGPPINADLQKINALLFANVVDTATVNPPAVPIPGQMWLLLAANPTGAWAGHHNHLALWEKGVWRFYVPWEGWRVRSSADHSYRVYNGLTWTTFEATSAEVSEQLQNVIDSVNDLSDAVGSTVDANISAAAAAAAAAATEEVRQVVAGVADDVELARQEVYQLQQDTDVARRDVLDAVYQGGADAHEALARVITEEGVRANADIALGFRIDSVTASLGSTNASVTAEILARANADSALGARIDTVTANLGTTNANVTSEAIARASGDVALGTRIDTVTASVGTTNANVSAEITARASADVALGVRIDTVTANLGTTNANVTSEIAARVSADTALGGRIDSVSASVVTTQTISDSLMANTRFSIFPAAAGLPYYWNDWSNGVALGVRSVGEGGRYDFKMAVGANVDAGIYQTVYLVPGDYIINSDVWLETGDFQASGVLVQRTSVGVIGAGGWSPYEAPLRFAVDADTSGAAGAGAPSIRRFSKKFTVITADVFTVYAMVAWSAFGSRPAKTLHFRRVAVDPIDATGIIAVKAAADVTTEISARATADSALGVRIDNVTASIGTTNANVSAETIARVSADSALGTRIDTVTANLGTANANISSEATARANADVALGQRIDTTNANLGSTNANVTSESVARANSDGALGGRIDTVTATVNGVGASLSITQGAVSTLQGRTSAFLNIVAAAGADPAFVQVYADGYGSNIMLAAAQVGIFNTALGILIPAMYAAGGNVRFFGNVQIDGNLALAGTFDTTALADYSVSRAIAASYNDSSGPGSNLAAGGTTLHNLTLATIGKPVDIVAQFDFYVNGIYNGSAGIGSVTVKRNGATIITKQFAAYQGMVGTSLIHLVDTPGAGNNNYTFEGSHDGGKVIGYKYTYLGLRETKK